MHCATGVAQVDRDSVAAAFAGPCQKVTPQQTELAPMSVSDLSPALAAINDADIPQYRTSQVRRSSAADATGDPPSLINTEAFADATFAGLGTARSKALVDPHAVPPVQDTGDVVPRGKIAIVDASGSIYPLHYPIIMNKYLDALPNPPAANSGYRAEHLLNIALLVTIVGGTLLSMISVRDKLGALWKRGEAALYGARRIVEVDQIDMQPRLSMDRLMRAGWSPELVRRLLGRPDYVVPHPQGRSEPLRFYDRERVLVTQASATFKRRLAKIETENARAAAQIRQWIVLCQLEAVSAAKPNPLVIAGRRDTQAESVPQAVPLVSR